MGKGKIKIGVIGTGWWGSNIIRTLNNFEDVGEILVFDTSLNATVKIKELNKVKIVDTMEEIENQNDISGVCIATPPSTHYFLTKRLLTAKKHVLIEKPPAMDNEELDELGEIAQKSNLIYMLDALYLFMEPIQELRKIINSIDSKQIRFVQLYRVGDELRRKASGIQRIEETMFQNNVDVVDDLFFHDAGILLKLFGDISLINTKKYFLYNENLCDSVIVDMQSNNFPIQLILSWTFSGRKRGMTIYTKDSIIEYDGLADSKQISKYEIYNKTQKDFSFDSKPPLDKQLRYYIDSIKGIEQNSLDFIFMKKIFSLWRKIKNEF